ncbi:crossover junction endonuclease MUS81 [Protopterus annectens]|uniref:crossover junction endonuclease MUS81 n=1 Tax=Protopterus annectens TaxID=7888 RepID=UPI001CFBE72E|nr:crossover junction endonuclease MUS81 [Protopterus annectens]
MSASVKYGRKKPLPPSPNPLFLQWLTEWRDKAAEKGKRTQFVYQKAINTLRKYPLPLRNGKEAKILQNFGDGICKMLDEKLAQYYLEHGPDAPIHCLSTSNSTEQPKLKRRSSSKRSGNFSDVPAVSMTDNLEDDQRENVGPCSSKRSKMADKKLREYVPQKRSGGYAVLLTLYQDSKNPHGRGFMTKPELQREAQPLCEKSLTLPDPGCKYTAWSSVSTLVQKGLVIKTNNPARYSLTEKGVELAMKLEKGEEGLDTAVVARVPLETVDLTEDEEDADNQRLPAVSGSWTNTNNSSGESSTNTELGAFGSGVSLPMEDSQESQSSTGCEVVPFLHRPEFIFKPGEFNIVLCVDFIETTGGYSEELIMQSLKKLLELQRDECEISCINDNFKFDSVLGQLRAPQPRELVLDYVVERKRMDDLCGSIIDGRFREQKFRLKRCGLKKPVYLIEDHGAVQHLSIPESTLQQAIVNTQVVDGFFIKRTKDVRESAAYLTIMTRYLQSLYLTKKLLCCTKEEDSKFDRVCSPSADSSILLTFGEFNEGAMKNKAQTVKEVFARQLMQISGISGEKASAILEKYSTPASLLKAYNECTTLTDQEKMLSCIKCGKLQR